MAELGAAGAPVDVGVVGNSAGFAPQPSPTESERPGEPNIAGEVGIGAAQGVGGLLYSAGKSLVLNALTLGGYSTYELGKSLWAGYREDGFLGALNAVNPFYAILKGGVDTYASAVKGDYRAAGRTGVVVAIATVATVLGVVKAVGAASGAAAQTTSGAAASAVKPSSRALGRALERAGQAKPPGSAAHHIIAGKAEAADAARKVLQKFGIGINDAENGVFLPGNKGSPNPAGNAVHSKLHGPAYYEAVNEALGLATTREKAIEILNEIRSSLQSGGFP